MAQLNVRERLIETKIAYVGSQLAGKATNLDCLSKDATRGRSSAVEAAGDVLSFDWRPLRRSLDCDVAVKVVAAKGPLSSERLDDVLANADGLVVVVDANPAAAEESLRTLRLVREKAPAVPVVVQVNKTDLANARPAREVTGDVDWPVVPAAATKGEGVFETLETALERIIDSIQQKKTATGEAKVDPNPLLTALREILRETIAECMTQIEQQTAKRIALSVTQHLAKIEDGNAQLRAALAKSAEESKRVFSAHEKALGEVARSLAELQTGTLDLVTREDFTGHETRRIEALASLAKTVEPVGVIPKLAARIGALDTSLHLVHTDTGEAVERVQQNVTKVREDLHELIEELKKPKRGWFG